MAAILGVLVVVISVGCSSGAGSAQPDTPAASSSAPAQSGANGPWKQVWSDEFNGQVGGGIDTRSWKFDTGQGVFGTDEVETMTSALPVSVSEASAPSGPSTTSATNASPLSRNAASGLLPPGVPD